MHIPSNKILKSNALHRVNTSENAGNVVLIYAGILTLMSALVTVVNYCLGLQINDLGGLSNMGTKSVLSTIQSVLPMVMNAITMCLNIGYLAAIMRITREQYVSPQTLKLGFDRFWLLLRVALFQFGIYMGAGMISFWLASQIYMITPLSDPVVALVTPYLSEASVNMDFLLDEVVYAQLVKAMIPMFILFGVLYCAIILPISYSFRMVNYLIVDKPGISAMSALSESRRMMRGKRLRLFKLDVSLWWWYALQLALTGVVYGDTLLPMLGVSLPFSETVSYFLFYFLSLAGQFALYVFLMNRVEVTYAQVYEKLRPRESDGGAVLGNIFQM